VASQFEDLKVWIDTHDFVKTIYCLTLNDQIRRDYSFKDQIRRASLSIMNNIAEGFERNNNKELIVFLKYSKGSAAEVRSMLYLARSLNYISEDQFKNMFEKSVDIIKQLSNFIHYLKKDSQFLKQNKSLK
jgi:four helix bundle protein